MLELVVALAPTRCYLGAMARGSIRIDTVKLRRLRENAGYSRRPFAEATGLSFSYIASLEIGQRKSVSPETAAEFARVLGTTIEDLRAPEA